MSALAGIWNFSGKADAGEACARMLMTQAIYGPHARSQWDGGNVALGRNLFRILPEDVFDRQPLEHGSQMLVADLRLDNRDELVADLQLPAERARAMADSEILFAAWERWREDCFDRLVGDYAFALWDGTARRLILARDPLGMRPLHYHRGKDFVAFASMPKGLHALPAIDRAPDEERIAEFLTLLPDCGPRSFFRDVERVEQGHYAVITAAGASQRRHWEPQRKTIRLASAAEYAEAMLHHLDRAVLSCLRGAGDAVGSHLSSGFDSSAVTASAALQMAPRGGRVVAFTSVPRAGYDGAAPRGRLGDEGPIAAKTAAMHPNIEHVLIRGNRHSPFANLDRAYYLYDSPVINPCNTVWHDAILDAARVRKLSVVLLGVNGNMTISYDGLTLLTRLMRTGRWAKWLSESVKVVRNGDRRWLGVLNQTFGPFIPVPIWTWLNRVLENRKVGLQAYSAISLDLVKELAFERRARARALDLSYRPRKDGFECKLWVMRRTDFGNIMKGVVAGWGVEYRDPTSDRRLIDFCLSVPEEQFLAGGVTKALTRRALAGRVAPEVINMRGKGYQAVDWHEGLVAARDEAREEIERLAEFAPTARALDVARLRRLIESLPDKGWERRGTTEQYRHALLRGIGTGRFLRRASGSNA